jgi:sugar phosphate permease
MMSTPGKPLQSAEGQKALYRKVVMRILPVLMFGYVLAYLDRVNIGFAKLQMQSDLHLSDAVYGLGAGIFFIGYFLCETPSNVIMARVGARRWIARIMITWGVLSVASYLTRGEMSFYAVRFFLGVAEAGFFPGVILYLTYWFQTNGWGPSRLFSTRQLPSPVRSVVLCRGGL